ncbi:MAG TPA: MFS transporter [Candidatus Acetothermia bacterium]|nr:MFS transporter [Candidatus Acetothermia bacterium]
MVYAIFIWHGIFLSLTMSMIDFNTVFPAMITDLVHSKIIFGILYSLMLGIPYLFSLLFGHFLSTYRYRRKFLLIGIYLRGLAFLGMAGFTFFFGARHPWLVVGSFFVWILVFSLSGGLAGIAYEDIFGKLVPKGERGKLYAVKQFASSLAAFGGGWIIARVFSVNSLPFPKNYALVLGIGFAGLVIASIAFWFIKEPPSSVTENVRPSLGSLLRRVPAILRENPEFFRFIVVENLSSFGLMVMPFYMIFAKDRFHVSDVYIGRYFLFQVGGTIISNLLWGWISGRFDSKKVVRFCLLLGGLIPLVALGIAHLGANVFAIVFLLVGFVFSGRRVGFEPYLLDIIPADNRPIYLGIRGTLNVLVVLLPFLGGVFIHFAGYLPVFVLVAAVMVSAFFLLGGKPAGEY